MASSPKTLTDSYVAGLKAKDKPYSLHDDLRVIHVSASGAKTWLWRYRAPDGTQRVYKLGKYPAMKSNEARDERIKLEKLVDSGIDPKVAEDANKKNTLWPVVLEWLKKKKTWSPYYKEQAETFLERYVKDGIGAMPIRSITVTHIYKLLLSIAERSEADKKRWGVRKDSAPHIAIRLRHHLEGIFSLAIVQGLADRNIIRDVGLTEILGDEKPKTRSNDKLSPEVLGELLRKLDNNEGNGGTEQTRIGIRLLLLTLTRTAELRCATWAEFDLPNATWTIPAERMKMRIEHVVPLSKQAIELLNTLRTINGKPAAHGPDLLFPNANDPKRPADPNTFNRALIRLGFTDDNMGRFRSHGARGTGSTRLNSMVTVRDGSMVKKYPSEVVEAALAHAVKGVKGDYDESVYLPERKVMAQDWADYLDGLKANAPL
jgi:integrase